MLVFLFPSSGILVLRSSLDREASSEIHLVVTATDGGERPRSASVRAAVTVMDVNDNAPRFPSVSSASSSVLSSPSSPLVLTVSEDAASGAVVARMEAADADEGDNGRVRYALEELDLDHDFGPAFVIDPETGALSTTSSGLDRERREKYELVVTAQDEGSPPKKTKRNIQVLEKRKLV